MLLHALVPVTSKKSQEPWPNQASTANTGADIYLGQCGQLRSRIAGAQLGCQVMAPYEQPLGAVRQGQQC